MTNTRLAIPTYNRVPAAPLLEYVERQGGVAELPGITGMPVLVETATKGGPFAEKLSRLDERIERTEEERRALKRAQKMIERARVNGWLDLHKVDDFCIEILGVHPAQIYGAEAWCGLLERHPVDLEVVENRITSGELNSEMEVVNAIRAMGATTEEVEDGGGSSVVRPLAYAAARRHMGDLDPAVVATIGTEKPLADWERELLEGDRAVAA